MHQVSTHLIYCTIAFVAHFNLYPTQSAHHSSSDERETAIMTTETTDIDGYDSVDGWTQSTTTETGSNDVHNTYENTNTNTNIHSTNPTEYNIIYNAYSTSSSLFLFSTSEVNDDTAPDYTRLSKLLTIIIIIGVSSLVLLMFILWVSYNYIQRHKITNRYIIDDDIEMGETVTILPKVNLSLAHAGLDSHRNKNKKANTEPKSSQVDLNEDSASSDDDRTSFVQNNNRDPMDGI